MNSSARRSEAALDSLPPAATVIVAELNPGIVDWCQDGLSEHAVHFWVTSRDTLVERNLLRNNARGVGFGLLDAAGAGVRLYGDNPCPSAGYVERWIRFA